MATHNNTAVVDLLTPTVLRSFRERLLEAVIPSYDWQQVMRAFHLGQLKAAAPVADGEYVGVLLYELVGYPNGTAYLRIVGLAGEDVERWLAAVVEWAVAKCRNLALNGVEICGRKGWAKLLAKYGPKEYAYLRLEVPWDSEQEAR